MSPRLLPHLLAALLALVAISGDVAWAGHYQQSDRRTDNRQTYQHLDKHQDYQAGRYDRNDPRDGDLPASVRRIQRETGGEVLKAQPIQRDGREVYRVKVLTPQGRIRVYEDEPSMRQPPMHQQEPRRNQPLPPPRRNH